MRQKDLIWVAILAAIVAFIIFPVTNAVFIKTTEQCPLLMGFIKFSILATMGELLGIRISKRQWIKPIGMGYRVIVWGFIGIVTVFVFNIFPSGVKNLIATNLLPSFANNVLSVALAAFFTSAFMNLLFGPTLMLFHKIMDALIEAGHGTWKEMRSVTLDQVVLAIDWNNYIKFIVLKTIPIFWIPAHTIVFMLPGNYRIIVAAFLSLALGVILTFATKSKHN